MRKSCIILLVTAVISSNLYSQVYNSGSTLSPGKFSIGIAPVIFVDHHNDVGLYATAGFGITRSVDFSMKLRAHHEPVYIGGDLEFVILSGMPTISLTAGMHAYNKLGLDGTFNLTFPIHHVASLYGGLDVDVEFHDDHTHLPLWGFVGLEITTRRHLAFIIEIDPSLNRYAYNMFCAGIVVYI
jgi:hypothetical protein